MRCRAVDLLCILSFTLSLAIVALWVRSYSHVDSLEKWTLDRQARAVFTREIASDHASLRYIHVDEKYLDEDHRFSEVSYPPEKYHGRWRYTTAPGPVNWGDTMDTFVQRRGFDARVWQSWRDGRRTDYSSLRNRFPDQATFDRFVRARRLAEDLFRSTRIHVRVPHWFVAGLFAVGPAVWVIRRVRRARRERRIRRGLCPACGYDLRASGGVCPECGRPVGREVGAGGDDAPAVRA